MRFHLLACVPVILACLPTRGSASDGKHALEIAVNGFNQTVEQISTIHVRTRADGSSGGKITDRVSTEWWQDGTKIRWKYTDDFTDPILTRPSTGKKPAPYSRQNICDILVVDGRITRLDHMKIPGEGQAKGAGINQGMYLAEAGLSPLWSQVNFTISDKPEIKLLDAMRSKEWHPSARWEELSGRHTILVEASSSMRDPEHLSSLNEWRPSFRAWFAPDRSFLPEKLMIYNSAKFDSKKPYSEYQVVRFHPPYKATGIGFPAEVVRRFYPAGEDPNRAPYSEGHIYCDIVEINDPIDPKMFDLKIPPGYRVSDRVQGQRYVMGTDGKPQSSAPILPVPIPRVEPAVGNWSWAWTGACVGSAALLLVVAYILAKMRRRAA